jgi:phage-related baseplate assembly protein
MADEALTYLAGLPKPTIIEPLDYETILADRKAAVVAGFDTRGVAYDVDALESDSAIILTEDASYREELLRARGNDIARARYRLYATGSDLDHLAEYYGVRRMEGETDDRLNARITLAQQGASVAGPEAYFARIAMAASIRVAEVRVWRESVLPIIHVSVLSTDNAGLADAELLAAVRSAVTADVARPMSAGTIVVESAIRRLVPVTAALTLLPSTSATIIDTLRDGLPSAWAAVRGGGRDLTRDWIRAALMGAGVYGVALTAPMSDEIADEHEWLGLGTVTLTLAGRAR